MGGFALASALADKRTNVLVLLDHDLRAPLPPPQTRPNGLFALRPMSFWVEHGSEGQCR